MSFCTKSVDFDRFWPIIFCGFTNEHLMISLENMVGNVCWIATKVPKTLYIHPSLQASTFCNDANLSATLMVVWRIDVCKKDHHWRSLSNNSHLGDYSLSVSIICRRPIFMARVVVLVELNSVCIAMSSTVRLEITALTTKCDDHF